MVKKNKGFTLIELIAVLVIMAILALIVTPLVMTIIKKARINADKRSVDAYGRSIELAVATFLLDNGRFPTQVSDLAIEYKGATVVCSTTQLNPDSSVYLTGCTVGGRTVDYTYGMDKNPVAYEIGDEVTYNNVDYYVIKDSGVNETSVTLLKKTPLTVQEVNNYGGVGTANNHVNMYVTSDTSASYYQTAYNNNGYGAMAYYSSTTCGSSGTDGCTVSYADSEIKYVVDAWKEDKAPSAALARLLTMDDLTDNLGMEFNQSNPTDLQLQQTENSQMWIFGSNYGYWMSTPNTDRTNEVWHVGIGGYVSSREVQQYGTYGNDYNVVRPVITLSKSALQS